MIITWKMQVKRVFVVIWLLIRIKAKPIWFNALVFPDGHYEKALYFLPMRVDFSKFYRK